MPEGESPLVETVLGAQFEPLSGLTNAHLGLFWKEVGEGWPRVQEVPRLEQVRERFEVRSLWAPASIARVRVNQVVPVRLQITNDDGDRMIQVQNGRLHLNWLGHRNPDYPRYRNLRPEFDHVLEKLIGFLGKASLGSPSFNQWELTYVNHIPRGTLWDSPTDWGTVLEGLLSSQRSNAEFPVESFSGQWMFRLPEDRGRVHVQVQHGSSESQDREVLLLRLTTRGPAQDVEGIRQGLDLGNQALREVFGRILCSELRQRWRLDDGGS